MIQCGDFCGDREDIARQLHASRRKRKQQAKLFSLRMLRQK
jgi:hypothetical protein